MEAVRKDEALAVGHLIAKQRGKPVTTRRSGYSDLKATETPALAPVGKNKGAKVRTLLRAKLGEDIYGSWFNAMEFETFDNGIVKVSVPVKFLRNWIKSHYEKVLLECCQAEFKGATKVDVVMRQVGSTTKRPISEKTDVRVMNPNRMDSLPGAQTGNGTVALEAGIFQRPPRTEVGGFEGSPLDPRYTFANFVVGLSNQFAHAAANKVAASVTGENPNFNPLFIHAAVGHGKTHLLHAIAWEAKRYNPSAKVLYLTAEGFRYRFVEAMRGTEPLAFRNKFRQVDILLIDDLEFMHGDKTEQEFEHIINTLLDGGRQVVVASARPPALIDRLNERMRSRLQRGLVTELGPLDEELRLKILQTRLAEKRDVDSSFNLSREVLELLAAGLTENGRELEGAVTRLFANWQYMRVPITLDIAETVVRDLLQGIEPRRIKIEDILRMVSRHYGVSKSDLLSQRRHRSIVHPRQIGMYLAKQMTTRSLPEIGRRFGNRDHTTVLHAVRKITKELDDNMRLKEEIEELKKTLGH